MEKLEDIKKEELEEMDANIKFLAEIIKDKIVSNGGEFSETISITPDGWLKLMDSDEKLKSLFVHHAVEGEEELFKLAKAIQNKSPEIKFNFERDPEGRWIKYTVNKVKNVPSN